MKGLYSNSRSSTVLLAVLTIFVLLASSADAQTKRRKSSKKTVKTTRTRPVTPVIVPLSAPGDATIISRNDDYQNDTQTLPIEPPTTQPQPAGTIQPTEDTEGRFTELSTRIKNLESKPANEYDQKQKRLLLNLDILTRAETRAESIRKQLFDMIEKESNINMKLEQIENDARPENIDRAVAFAGTLRPEELRDTRAKNLDSEKRNLQNLLLQIQETKANLQTNVERADQLVEKLRSKLEQDINDALADEPKN